MRLPAFYALNFALHSHACILDCRTTSMCKNLCTDREQIIHQAQSRPERCLVKRSVKQAAILRYCNSKCRR
jgi:hypothetical protein